MSELLKLKERGEAPEWLTEEGYSTLKGGYLLPNETPRGMYRRVANSVASNLNKPELANKFYKYIDLNYLCLSTPIASNAGTDRGLPISCFGLNIDDSVNSIYKAYYELAILSKNAGGTAANWMVRGANAPISGGGTSSGLIPWLKAAESCVAAIKQGGSLRRGSAAHYANIEHSDFMDFVNIRRPTGGSIDPSRRCLDPSFHHGVIVSDKFLQEALDGNKKNQERWRELLKVRMETGEPYIMFEDNANKNLSECYKNNGLKINMSNLCTEIFLYNDFDHTFVCCLASLNLSRYFEWKDTDLISTAIVFLDGIMTEFIKKASKIEGLEKAVRFAEKSRSLGLGALGWHSLLQSQMIPFDSFEAMKLNAEIFKKIQKEAIESSIKLGEEYGVPLWCQNSTVKMRNLNLLAVAPTLSNSLISGGVSQGIEPIVSNYWAQKSAKGVFIRKNPMLEKHLESIGKNTFETWNIINDNKGSVKELSFLSDEVKEVFATARQISPEAIIKQAGQRQKYIDQGQSINLFFSVPANQTDEDKKKLAKYINKIHLMAWRENQLKSLYYLRTENILKGETASYDFSDCKACEG